MLPHRVQHLRDRSCQECTHAIGVGFIKRHSCRMIVLLRVLIRTHVLRPGTQSCKSLRALRYNRVSPLVHQLRHQTLFSTYRMLCFIFVERIVYFRWSGQAASDAGHILRRVIAINKDARDLIPSTPLLDSTGRRCVFSDNPQRINCLPII